MNKLWMLVVASVIIMFIATILGLWKLFIIAAIMYITALFVIRLIWERNNK